MLEEASDDEVEMTVKEEEKKKEDKGACEIAENCPVPSAPITVDKKTQAPSPPYRAVQFATDLCAPAIVNAHGQTANPIKSILKSQTMPAPLAEGIPASMMHLL